MYGLENKIALVTGGSRGIGLATANELANCGSKVIILHRDNSTKCGGGGICKGNHC